MILYNAENIFTLYYPSQPPPKVQFCIKTEPYYLRYQREMQKCIESRRAKFGIKK